MDLGEDKVREMAEAFGLDGETFDIPLRVEASGIGDIADEAALAQTSIGQRDVRMTPLQAALVAATVANDGVQMKPYLVDQVQAPDLTVIDSTNPEEWREPISSEVADQLTEMMISVVANGSGRAARIPGVEVAGKTGTAQVSADVADHTWFMGFAPADDPKIAVAVFVANGGGTGGERSAPIARQVIQAYLDGLGE
jgi:penicillin-binding protein A